MRRMRRVMLVPVLLLLAAGIAWAAVAPGQKAPNFTLKDILTGKTVSLQSLKGKPVLLDIFATW